MAADPDWTRGFIAIDWGTTNRRAWAVPPEGTPTELLADDRGVLNIKAGAFEAEIAGLREHLPGLPMLLAGMIGSDRGWVEAPYLAAPAALDDVVRGLISPIEGVFIVPGISWRDGNSADVMRGEEVQLLGADLATGLACHPGTHCKWVRVQQGAIGPFRTVMTGELFAMLSAHGILKDRLRGEVSANEDFRRGVRHALAHDDLTAELFTIRARHLLGVIEDGASYASGLLIGADVRIGLDFGGDGPVALIGRTDLTALYAEALTLAGREASEHDGEQAFIAGARAIAERLS